MLIFTKFITRSLRVDIDMGIVMIRLLERNCIDIATEYSEKMEMNS